LLIVSQRDFKPESVTSGKLPFFEVQQNEAKNSTFQNPNVVLQAGENF